MHGTRLDPQCLLPPKPNKRPRVSHTTPPQPRHTQQHDTTQTSRLNAVAKFAEADRKAKARKAKEAAAAGEASSASEGEGLAAAGGKKTKKPPVVKEGKAAITSFFAAAKGAGKQ